MIQGLELSPAIRKIRIRSGSKNLIQMPNYVPNYFLLKQWVKHTFLIRIIRHLYIIRECRIKTAFSNIYFFGLGKAPGGRGDRSFWSVALGPFLDLRCKGARLRVVYVVRGRLQLCIISTPFKKTPIKHIAKLISLAKMQVLVICLGLVTPLNIPRACTPNRLANQNFLTHRVVPRVKMLGHLAVTDND